MNTTPDVPRPRAHAALHNAARPAAAAADGPAADGPAPFPGR